VQQQQQQATYKLKQALLQNKKNKNKSVILTKHDNDNENIVVVRPRPKQSQEHHTNAFQASQEGVAGTQYVEGATLQQKQQQQQRRRQRQRQQGGALQTSQEGVEGNVGMVVAVTNNVPRNGGMVAVSQDDETAASNVYYKHVQGQQAILLNPQQQSAETNTIVSETVPLSNVQGQQAVLMSDASNTIVSETVPLSNVQGQQAVLMSDASNTIVSETVPLSNVQGQQAVLMNPPAAVAPMTRIMYYDASLEGIPETVYDESGKAYLLASLQKEGTDIYMERPAPQQQQQEEEDANPLQKESLETLQQESVPVQTLDMPQSWGRSKSQDQFIVIATVATMALLVGALSARKLRVANFLNSCIENEETLQNEYMYDAAYTTNGYDTFGGGPWKGDLEKFDV
jgi:hypothetical protein